ncbi:MAG: hypothetical protein NT066_06425 [Candidatus Omnitrophica bacterium]|nr:hypothetical protein [Candidatus Omnitrophota bacterium]
MTKEMAVSLPFILLSYSYLRSKRLEIKLVMPYLVILCAYMLFRFLILKGMGGYAMMFPPYESMPVHLCLAFLRTHLLFSYTDSYYLLIYLALIFTLGFLGVVHFKSFENKNKIFFAFSWIGITILPLYRISAFRLLYLPSIGFAMLLSLVCLELHKKNFKYPVIFIMVLSVMLARVNMKNQDLFSPASNLVLDADKVTYVDWHNKLDKEQLTLLEQKLKRYGLFDEAEDFLKRGEKVFNPPKIEEATVSAYIKKLYEQGGLDAILRKHFCIY